LLARGRLILAMSKDYSLAWRALPGQLQEQLTGLGFESASMVATLDDLAADALVAEVESMVGRALDPEDTLAMVGLVAAAGPAAKRLRMNFVLAKDMEFYKETRPTDREKDLVMQWRAGDAKIAKVGKAKVARWPTRLARKLASAGGDEDRRSAAEAAERDRWKARLMRILVSAGLPASLAAEGSHEGKGQGGRVADQAGQ
jgi:hypothetical protein